MRRSINTYGALLLIIGSLLKILFVSMFSSTVLAVIASILGGGNVALPILSHNLECFLENLHNPTWCDRHHHNAG